MRLTALPRLADSRPKIRQASETPDNIMPRRSNRLRAASRSCGMKRVVSTMPRIPTGRLM